MHCASLLLFYLPLSSSFLCVLACSWKTNLAAYVMTALPLLSQVNSAAYNFELKRIFSAPDMLHLANARNVAFQVFGFGFTAALFLRKLFPQSICLITHSEYSEGYPSLKIILYLIV